MFNCHDFYNVIVEWFEETSTENECKFIAELLLWWNRQVIDPTCMIINVY